MISITFSGESIEDVAIQAKNFTVAVLPEADLVTSQPTINANNKEERKTNPWGYHPYGVGYPEIQLAPIDDGTEWNEDAIEDWLLSCSVSGRKVIKALAVSHVIDPRETYKLLGMDGNTWSGTWNGPRRQAARVKESRQLSSWPYGHSYEEPRRLWMHPKVADRVVRILEKLKEK